MIEPHLPAWARIVNVIESRHRFTIDELTSERNELAKQLKAAHERLKRLQGKARP